MRAALAGSMLGALAIVAFAAFWLLYAIPARAETCRGMTLLSSWYGAESGNKTADGSFFDGNQMIAASRSMAFGTRLRLTYRGRSVTVTVRDRGPAKWTGRDLDISRAAAVAIGLIHAGVGRVCAERLTGRS